MRPKDHRLRVGVTLTAFTVLAFALVFSLDSTASWWSGYREFKVVFPHVQGLRPNDPVQFQGVPCGRVVSVAIRCEASPPHPNTAFAEVKRDEPSPSSCEVELTLEVPSEFFAHLRTQSRARIEKTLTGVTVVNLEHGHGDPLTEGAEIRGEPAVTIDEVTTELRATAQHLTSILAEIDPIVHSLRTDGVIVSAIANVDEAGRKAAELADSLRGLVADNSNAIRAMTDGAAKLIGDLESTLPGVREFVGDARGVAAETGSLASSLRRWIRDSRGSVDASLDNIERASGNLKELSSELERRPWRLLHAPSELEARELGLYDSASAFSAGALEFRRSIDAVRVLLEGDLDEEVETVLRRTLEGLERDAEAYRAMQGQFWEKLQKLYEE